MAYGDIELMTRIYARMGDRLTYIGGLPTAETFALPYLEMGVTTYSSAIFNFLPQFAQDFYAAVRRRDHEQGLRRVSATSSCPTSAIRNRRKGYAVSIVKAGMTAIGRPAGPVRSPLIDLIRQELASLKQLDRRPLLSPRTRHSAVHRAARDPRALPHRPDALRRQLPSAMATGSRSRSPASTFAEPRT